MARETTKYQDISLPGGWTIETWYERTSMSWVSQLKDERRNQVGEAYYDGHSSHVPSSRQSLIDRHRNEWPRDLDEY